MQPLGKKDPKTIGGYTLIGRLGAGGMGVVYLASKGSESVALKVVRDSLIEEEAQLARFKREIATLESINHPNIARILDSGVDGEQAWFAAEFANGPDLSARVKDKGPLDEDEWWTLAEGLMSALAAVHATGVIHRDVKPSNVILTEAGPKLIDFGIAHVSDATSVTSTGMVAGSPAWFSPEQIEGFDLTPATDVFSAGSVLTLAATGSSPWGDETTMTKASVFKILTNEPNIDALEGVKGDFVGMLLEKETGDRPAADAAAEAAAARDVSGLASGSSVSGETTRVAPRPTVDKVGPSFTRAPTQRPPSGVAKTSENTNSSKRRRFGPKALAAVLIPAVAALGLIVARQSEAVGETRIVVRVADSNPIVGAGSLTLSTESQNPQVLSIQQRETIMKALRWRSWEEVRLTYEPAYSESEDLEAVLSPEELGLTGFNTGDELKLLLDLQDEVTVIRLDNISSDSTIKTWRLKRENEEAALQNCVSAVSRAIQADLAEYKGLWEDYVSSRAEANLEGSQDYLLYATWASRMEKLVGLMAADRAAVELVGSPREEASQTFITRILTAHTRLAQAWSEQADSARAGARAAYDGAAPNWDDNWNTIWDEEDALAILRDQSVGQAAAARTVCESRIQ